MEAKTLPDWVYKKEEYSPSSDRDFFISRSILRILQILLQVREQPQVQQRTKVQAGGKLVLLFLVILLTTNARTGAFLLLVFSGELVLLCQLSSARLLRIFRLAGAAAFFSFCVLLPSDFWGNQQGFLLLTGKSFLTVTAVALVAETSSWNALTAGLRFFRLPQLFILTLDLALKYIVLLGEISLQMLYALKLRSIGRNRQKSRAVSGVLGNTFLKSKEWSEETWQAMCCRGFTGEYQTSGSALYQGQLSCLLCALLLLALFIYIEGVYR